MTSDTGNHTGFWAHKKLACKYFNEHKILTPEQFDQVDWKSTHSTLHNLSQLFQLWASKHVLGITGTMKSLSHQDGRSPLSPSCLTCIETCRHVTTCQEAGRTKAFVQSAREVERWLTKTNTPSNLAQLVAAYLRGRGSISCIDCSINLDLPPIYQTFTKSQDVIGWDGFAMGMVSHTLISLYSAISHTSSLAASAMWRISGLITHLLQVTHTQWIYRCVLVRDRTTGSLISAHKQDLLNKIEYQLSLGPEGLDEQDQFLLECNFDDLTTTAGEGQEYWLLTISTARAASHLRLRERGDEQQSRPRKRQRRA